MEHYVVVNRQYGGFGLSREAVKLFNERTSDVRLISEDEMLSGRGLKEGEIWAYQVRRDHPVLIQVVRDLGSKRASGESSSLRIYRVHIDIDMDSRDGMESPQVSGWAEAE